MADKHSEKLKNLFFYGVSFAAYDTVDVSRDIITNIRRRFLVTQKPASNKLYRSANGERFVYSYNFSPERALQWKVSRNKHIIEEIEYLLSGKYCINYYDENGRDLKKVFFDPQHRWLKTNYYNSVSSESLTCSLVPKEFEEGTSILKYLTGAVYPERLYSCTVPSCEEVRERVLERIPTPVVAALTEKGVVYFLPEEDKYNYEKILVEEEERFKAENAPKVYVSAEDSANGFNLKVDDFDMSKNLNRTFDISLAEYFDTQVTDSDVVRSEAESVKDTEVQVETEPEMLTFTPAQADDGSVDAAITGVVQQINALTSLDINADDILNIEVGNFDEKSEVSEPDAQSDFITFDSNDPAIDEQLKHIDSVLDGSSLLNSERKLVIGDSVVDEDYISSIIDGIISSAFDIPHESDEKIAEVAEASPESVEEISVVADADLTENRDSAMTSGYSDESAENVSENGAVSLEISEAVDESLKSETSGMADEETVEKFTGVELSDEAETYEAETSDKASFEPVSAVASSLDYINENPADMTIESRGETYFYYGSVDENGKRSGRGRTLMSDGSIAYEGEYKDDKRKGQGSFYFKDGSLCYWGNWDDNVRSGFGVGVSSDDKAVHAGNWVGNKPSGLGIRFDSEGNLMFISSSCEDKKKGFTISDFSDSSFTVRVWSEKDEAFIQREISIGDIIK